jgi:hypothetical protein
MTLHYKCIILIILIILYHAINDHRIATIPQLT